MSNRSHRHGHRALARRRGASWLGVSIALVVIVGALLGAGWIWTSAGGLSTTPIDALAHTASRKPFRHMISVKGEVESSSNVDVRCMVKAQNSAGTAILWIVPEGTYVQPGDKLVELDSSAMENERTGQQIVVNTSKALVIQAQNVYETAKIAKTEYENGTFTQEKKTITGEIFTAEEDLRRAEQYLIYSKELYAKDFYTELQLKADEFAVEQAKNALELAENKLYVLENYTKEKMLKQLEADIQTAKAKLDSEEKSHRLDLKKLEEIDEQISHCVIYADAPGQVVYANEDNYRGDDVVIEEGTMVRERQVLIRLPDPAQMQVKCKVHEAHIKLVNADLPATIRIDAFPDLTLAGTVTRVSEMPESGGWRRGNIREYATLVQIHSPPQGIRPGMNSEVHIEVERSSDELQVPVQAVVEHGDKYYCLLQNGGRFEAREILIGSSNEKFIVIRDGLRPDERVLMSPRTYLSEVNLPAAPERQVATNDQELERSPEQSADQRNARGPQAARVDDKDSANGQADAANDDSTNLVSTIIEKNDADADGRLSRDEAPQDMRDRFQDTDSNGDGFLDSQELIAMVDQPGTPTFGGSGAGQ